VVPSRQIKALRSRYGSAGNKDDRFDAYVLADTLRTDGHRWQPLRPDAGPTRALRALCRSRKDLVETRVQVLGQLRANLELAFPGAIGLFSKPGSPISLAFLRRFPTAAKAAWLSPARLAAWLRSAGYTGGVTAAVLHGRLAGAAPGLTGPEGDARGQITLAFAAMTGALNEQISALDTEIGRLFAAHPDQHIFSSLPRSGTIRAASLLAEIGDCRQRFPTDDALAALAGACPQRGNPASAARRYFAGRATRNSALPSWTSPTAAAWPTPWAAAIYAAATGRGTRHPHAIRILARAWLRIIWRCWQDGTAFDPALHRAAT
jgi:transposase